MAPLSQFPAAKVTIIYENRKFFCGFIRFLYLIKTRLYRLRQFSNWESFFRIPNRLFAILNPSLLDTQLVENLDELAVERLV